MGERTGWIIVAVTALAACPASSDKERPANTDTGAQDVGGAKREPRPGRQKGEFDFQIVLDGDFEAVGAIDKDIVRKVVKENVTKLQTCYEQTWMANPNISGTVTATFTIDNGSVTNIKASGVHPDVEACVIKAVQLFKFPPGGKVDVTYPFTFKPAQ